ncbi:MAG: hypothetical protein U0794_21390 [Isosphaeraceae bacterium]
MFLRTLDAGTAPASPIYWDDRFAWRQLADEAAALIGRRPG